MMRNRATPDGRAPGEQLARMVDEAEPRARLKVPDLPPRCASCAFRRGDHHGRAQVRDRARRVPLSRAGAAGASLLRLGDALAHG